MTTSSIKTIDLSAIWNDAVSLGRTNLDLLTAIAGMFLLLPAIVADQLMTPLHMPKESAGGREMMERLVAHGSENWPVLLGNGLLTAFGILAMLALLLRTERLTVGQSLKAALIALPGYFIANILQSFAVIIGLFLFIVPGFYLIARFSLIAAVAAAEQRGNPIEILQRSVVLTRGNGWLVFLMIAIIFAVGTILGIAVGSILGAIATLLFSGDGVALVQSILSALVETLLALAITLATAALYRALSESESPNRAL